MTKSPKFLFSLLFTLLFLISCSTDERETPTNNITGTNYGFAVRTDGTNQVLSFTYKLFNKKTGEIFYAGVEDDGDSYNPISFPVTDKELEEIEVSIEIKMTSEFDGRIENYFHVYNDELNDKYNWLLDWDRDPNAYSPFSINRINYNSTLDIYEGTFPVMAEEEFWFLNDGNTRFNNKETIQ